MYSKNNNFYYDNTHTHTHTHTHMPDVNACHEENFVEGLAAGLLAMKVQSRVVCQPSVVFDDEPVAHGKKSTPSNNNIWIISLTASRTLTRRRMIHQPHLIVLMRHP